MGLQPVPGVEALRIILTIVSLLAAVPSSACAQSDRFDWSPNYNPGHFKAIDRTIDPDGDVYGLPFGSEEKDIVAAFGEPTGVVVLTETRKGYLYGKSHLFVYRNGKLRELFIRDEILDWDVSKQMEDHSFFDSGQWVLGPGIKRSMKFDEVMDALERPQASPDYRYSIDGERSATKLRFSRHSGASGGESYVLHGIAITYYGE